MLSDIIIKGARVHNLKNIDITLPRNKLIVFTGLSGSGKSSLAFDTIFAEGQRRYMESLSSYARQFLDQMDKPDVDSIEGLSPAISIDQKSASGNPRSTVGTITEIYDYLRLLFASIGKPHCPECAKPIQSLSVQEMVELALGFSDGQVMIMSPIVQNKKGEFKDVFDHLSALGFTRVRVDGELKRLDEPIKLAKTYKHSIDLVVDRIRLNEDNRARLTESIETALQQSKGLLQIEEVDSGKKITLSERLSCPDCHLSLTELSPRLFSFNSPIGACPGCNGLGDKMDFDPALVIVNPENPVKTCTGKVLNLDGTTYGNILAKTAAEHGFDINTPYNKLIKKHQNIVLFGREDAVDENPYMSADLDKPTYRGIRGPWEGIMTNLRRRFVETNSHGMRFFFRSYMRAVQCERCHGGRLKPEALAVTVNKKNIQQLTTMPIQDLIAFFDKLKLTKQEQDIVGQVLKEIRERTGFLNHVGLSYLSLSRKAGTLSGGEFQRIRLATQIGVGLTGVLYVLDEPSIGLHQRDNLKLIETLKRLRDLGNTLVIVEHDEDTIMMADHVVDIGPGAGVNGGSIIYNGTVKSLLKQKASVTANYLSKEKEIVVTKTRQKQKIQRYLSLEGASENNLKNVTLKLPLGNLICITGVSGSGKSTLINGTLNRALMQHFHGSKERPGKHSGLKGLEHIDKVITIDQSPIGRTPRSNPATYTGLFGPIRDLFTQTKEAKIRGYKPGRFSFNVKGGRCEACEGDGMVKIEMHFLNDVYVTCDVCKGKRYNDQTLAVKYKGYSIADVLAMTVHEALSVFENIPAIYKKLKTLDEVGLSYIHLGQSATTLSGGEAQRIKLAKELSKRSTGKTLYLLDEPTTGLHFADIHQLLIVLNRLVEVGNTVVIIEHNIDVIRQADHIVDLGPEGGAGGGEIIAEGSPAEIKKEKRSYTGQFI